jgi:hypothetical protein
MTVDAGEGMDRCKEAQVKEETKRQNGAFTTTCMTARLILVKQV